jgi:hypothetical protein
MVKFVLAIYTADWPEMKLLTLTYGSVMSSKYCHKCLCNTRTNAHVWDDDCAERTIEGTKAIIGEARWLKEVLLPQSCHVVNC